MFKGTYPRITRLADGSLLGAVSYGENGETVIAAITSTDEGVTWSPLGVVTHGTGDISNQYPLQLPSGRILMAFRNHDKDANGSYVFFRITVCFSDDGGKTWQFLSQAATDPAGPNGNWEPLMRLANDGTLQIYYSRENAANDQDSLMRTSTDGGANWTSANIISGSDVTQRDGMIGVANYGGDNLLAIFETTINGKFQVWSVTSGDDGKTWGNRRIVYAPSDANANAGAPQVVAVGNTLVASFMTDEDAPGASGAWPAGASMKIVTSQDGGATWTQKTTVFNSAPNSFWPGMITLDGTSLLAVADQAGSKAVRVSLS
ncbi:Sialidase [Auriculariales sp. MPI-PUGE-AT-0066]|nr:Sialidase [Auriculariales sp. MPI-PUGE-AT-0066]